MLNRPAIPSFILLSLSFIFYFFSSSLPGVYEQQKATFQYFTELSSRKHNSVFLHFRLLLPLFAYVINISEELFAGAFCSLIPLYILESLIIIR